MDKDISFVKIGKIWHGYRESTRNYRTYRLILGLYSMTTLCGLGARNKGNSRQGGMIDGKGIRSVSNHPTPICPTCLVAIIEDARVA